MNLFFFSENDRDPLFKAMELFETLHQWAKRRKEIKKSYLDLADKCETFATELLEVIKNVLCTFFLLNFYDQPFYCFRG